MSSTVDDELHNFIQRMISGENVPYSQFSSMELSVHTIEILELCVQELRHFIVTTNMTKGTDTSITFNRVLLDIEEEIRKRPISDGIIEEPTTTAPTAMLLFPVDYPLSFRGIKDSTKMYAHPGDYIRTSEPIAPDLFLYKVGSRTRLFMRASVKVAAEGEEDAFIHATFLLDTGCCPHFMVSSALKRFVQHRLIKSEVGDDYMNVVVNGESMKCIVRDQENDTHKPANFMGLPMFFALGITFQQKKVSALVYDQEDVAHHVASHSLTVI